MGPYGDFLRQIFDPCGASAKPEVLAGVRILDLTHVVYGPHATGILARFGAEVIKVELPYEGDFFRTATNWGKYWKHSSPIAHFLHQNKYFVAIDMKKPKGKDLIRKLAEMSDVVAENFAPGTLDTWGVGYTELRKVNPKIIYLSCSTYGQFGPLRFFPGWDLLAQAMSGVLSITGYPDTDKYYKLPDYLGDFIPGCMAALAVLIAIYYRNKTGQGQYIDLAQSEVLMRLLYHFSYLALTGTELGRVGNSDPTMSPSGIFPTADDKFVAVAAATDKQFKSLCLAMGNEGMYDEYKDTLVRLKPENKRKLDQRVAEWVRGKTCEEVVRLGGEYGFPAARVVDDFDIIKEDWRWRRGSIVLVDDQMYGKFAMPGPPALLSETPARTKWLLRPVGYHNRYILKTLLGMSEEEIVSLEKERVIGYWDDRPGLKPPVYYEIDKDDLFNYHRDGGKV